MSDWSTTIRRTVAYVLSSLFATSTVVGVSSWLLFPEKPAITALTVFVCVATFCLIATFLIERERTRREALKHEVGIIRAKAEYAIAKAQADALTACVEAATSGPRKKEAVAVAKDVRADSFKVLKHLGDQNLRMAQTLHEPGPDTDSPDPGSETSPHTEVPDDAETAPGPRRLATSGDEEAEPAAS